MKRLRVYAVKAGDPTMSMINCFYPLQFRNPWTGEIEYIVAKYSPCKSQQLQQEHPINVQQQQQRQVTHQSITNTQQVCSLTHLLFANSHQTNICILGLIVSSSTIDKNYEITLFTKIGTKSALFTKIGTKFS